MSLTADKLGSVLVADIGTVTTRVTLIDTVDGEARFIAQAVAPSSTEAPHHDALVGIIEATLQIARLTDRVLLDDGRLIFPQNSERNGINHIVVTTSAASPMAVLIMGIAHDVSARSAARAARCTYTTIVQEVTLDDATLQPDMRRSWVERQVQRMLEQRPDVVVFAGGIENDAGAPNDVVQRLAHVVAFALQQINANAAAESGTTDIPTVPVIYAGNTASHPAVQQAIGTAAPLVLVDNLRPTLAQERLEPTRQELTRIYAERMLPTLQGYTALQMRSSMLPSSVVDASGLMTRFFAEQTDRHVLTVDIGSAASMALYAAPRRYIPTVLSGLGTGYGILELLQRCPLEQIQRWLPFAMPEQELAQWLSNKALHPHLIPASLEDLLIEHALTRELLTLLLHTAQDELPTLTYDMLIAGGGVLAHAPPGLAALTLLDALQPSVEHTAFALDLHLDKAGLMPVTGALAKLSSDAALTLFERDLLNNTPLATVIVALGEGAIGKPALEAELTDSYGKRQQVRIAHGQIVRLPLAPSVRGQIRLRPSGGVRIGNNEPGAAVASEVGVLEGSLLGVVIDARGRPLRLPKDEAQRQQLLWEWLVALGAAKGASPYTGMPLSNVPTIEASTVAVGIAGAAAVGVAAKRGLFGGGKQADTPAPVTPIASASDAPAPPAPAPAKPKRGLFGGGKQADAPAPVTPIASPSDAPVPSVPPVPPAPAKPKRGLFGGGKQADTPVPAASAAPVVGDVPAPAKPTASASDAPAPPAPAPAKPKRGLFGGGKQADTPVPAASAAPVVGDVPAPAKPKRGLFGGGKKPDAPAPVTPTASASDAPAPPAPAPAKPKRGLFGGGKKPDAPAPVTPTASASDAPAPPAPAPAKPKRGLFGGGKKPDAPAPVTPIASASDAPATPAPAPAKPKRGLFGGGKKPDAPAPVTPTASASDAPAPPAPAKPKRGLFGGGKKPDAPAPVTPIASASDAPTPPATPASAPAPATPKRGLVSFSSGKPKPATQPPPDAPTVTPGTRISLEDLAAQPPASAPPAPTVTPGTRISLEDLAAQDTAAQSPAPQGTSGQRVSLDDLRKQERSGSTTNPEAERLQQDLNALRGSLGQEEPKRGWFGRKKK